MYRLFSCHVTCYLCLMISVKKSSLRILSNISKLREWGVLQGQSDVTISIIVIFLENIGHPLQADTTLDEEIKADSTLIPLIICHEERVHELRA